MKALEGLQGVAKASFDAQSERFTVTVRGGQSVSRGDIERVVSRRAASEQLPYRVVWSSSDRPDGELAKRGAAFSAPLLAGGTYDFAEVLGDEPVVLTFWASWCAPCLEEAPHLQRLFETYGGHGVAFAAVSIDEPDDYPELRSIVRDNGLGYPVPLDPRGDILARYARGAAIPLTFVLSRSGEIVYRNQNFQAGDEVALEASIRQQVASSRGEP